MAREPTPPRDYMRPSNLGGGGAMDHPVAECCHPAHMLATNRDVLICEACGCHCTDCPVNLRGHVSIPVVLRKMFRVASRGASRRSQEASSP
eukprot:1098538-Pyramimonas_sp.AAC.1